MLCIGKMSDGLMFNGDIRVAISAFWKNGALRFSDPSGYDRRLAGLARSNFSGAKI